MEDKYIVYRRNPFIPRGTIVEKLVEGYQEMSLRKTTLGYCPSIYIGPVIPHELLDDCVLKMPKKGGLVDETIYRQE